MAAVNKATLFLSGKVYWAKIIGKPRPNYGGDALEWAFEFEPDAEGIEKLKQQKVADRLKDKYEDQGRGKFITLKKSELTKMGEKNAPIRIYDHEDNAWDESKLLGNGTEVDVKLDIRDYGPGKKKGIYPVAVRVRNLVQYQSSEFGGMDKADEEAPVRKPATKPKAPIEGLDDDVPF